MCFKDRSKPANIVIALSIIVILCGIAMVTESIIFTMRGSILTADLGDWTEAV